MFLCWQAQYIFNFLFVSVTFLSRSFLRIVKRSSIHGVKSGFEYDLIDPIVLECFTTFNFMTLCKYVHAVVDLKCC